METNEQTNGEPEPSAEPMLTDEQIRASRRALEAAMASVPELKPWDWCQSMLAAATRIAKKEGVPEPEFAGYAYMARRSYYGGPIATNQGELSFESFEAALESDLPIEVDTSREAQLEATVARLRWLSGQLKKQLHPYRENFCLFVIPDGATAETVGYVSTVHRADAIGMLQEWTELQEGRLGLGELREPSIHTVRMLRGILSALKPEDVVDVGPHRTELTGLKPPEQAARELEAAAHHLYRLELLIQAMREQQENPPADAGAQPEAVG